MHYVRTILTILVLGAGLAGCATTPREQEEAWKEQLHSNLAVMGARNWIVIAESSYPSYTGPGVTTMATQQPAPEVFLQVLDSLERGGYVQPRIMISSELRNIDEGYAPGIKRYRAQVSKLLPGRLHYELPNRIINGQIESAVKQFKVLVIKTSTTLPYSNIYIELDSGYWNTDAETALRNKIEKTNKPPANASPEEQPARRLADPAQITPAPRPAPPANSLPTLPKETNGSQVPQPSAKNDIQVV